MAGGGGAPAEVDVVAEDRQLVVEPAELVEHRAAHQHAGGVDREHRARLVVLALVVLAALQPGLAAAGAGDRDAELEQPLQRGPLAQLRAEHVGARGRRPRRRAAPAAPRGAGWRRRAGPRPTRCRRRARRAARARPDRGRERRSTPAPRPRSRRRRRASSRSALPSLLPVSTATTVRDRCQLARPARRSPSGSQRSPSWLTSSTATSSRPRAESRRVTRIGGGHDRSG